MSLQRKPYALSSRNVPPRYDKFLERLRTMLSDLGERLTMGLAGSRDGPPVAGLDERLNRITARVGCTRLRKESRETFEDSIPVEEPVAIMLNGRQAFDATISPYEVKEFVIGHLISEGQIVGPEDIESYLEGEGWAEAKLRGQPRQSVTRKVIFSGCFGGSDERPRLPQRIEKVDSDLTLDYAQVQRGIQAVEDSHVHRLTGGVHTTGIFLLPKERAREPPLLVGLCDDIGRHNALDKAIGKAAIQGCCLARCFVVTTGRASSEMVAKCYTAGIPVLASRGATSTLAVEVAKMAGITLMAFARKSRINVYCNEWRVVGVGALAESHLSYAPRQEPDTHARPASRHP